MKDRIAVLVATMSLVVFCICSCKKGDSIVAPIKQEVTFSFKQNDLKAGSANSLKLSYLKEDAKYVVVSIEKSDGENCMTPNGWSFIMSVAVLLVSRYLLRLMPNPIN